MIARISTDTWLALSVGAMITTCLGLIAVITWAVIEIRAVRKQANEERDRLRAELIEFRARISDLKANPLRELPDGESSAPIAGRD